MSRRTVLFLTSFPPPLTGQNVVSEQAARWAAEVARVVRLDTADTADATGPAGRARKARQAVGLWGRLRSALRDRPDTVYLALSSSTAGRLRDAATVAFVRRRTSRIVGHVHVGDFGPSLSRPPLAALSRWMMRRVDVVLVLSERLAAPVRAVARPGAVRVVPNTAPGLVPPPDVVAQARRQRGDDRELRVLLVANALEGKGHRAMLRGLAAYQATDPARPAKLDVVGAWTPERRAAFDAEADRLGVSERVRVLGIVTDRARLGQMHLGAHVVALPSRYRHEALPLCLIEALAAGTPVVGTDHGAIADVVTDQTGVLLPDDGPGAIAGALRQLAEPGVWAERSRAARDAFDQRFAPEPVRRALLDALGLP